MEPIRLVCGGCGVRIRAANPEKARRRPCPRCSMPLGPAVDLALGIVPEKPGASRAGSLAAVAVVLVLGSLAGLASRDASPGPRASTETPPPRVDRLIPVVPALAIVPEPSPTDRLDEVAEADPEVPADLSAPPAPPRRDPALLFDARRDPIFSPSDAAVRALDRTPPPAPLRALDPSPTPPVLAASGGPRRLLVRDSLGRSIVAREYGVLKGRTAALLPDGQIGWPEGLVVTADPFVPASMAEVERALRAEPEFEGFGIIQTAHYLVAFEGSEPFARASGELLEKLHDGLTGMLKRNGLAVAPMEFPLVAVIFATEDHLRANRRVAPDVQAYYEILSNRIFFYEKSRRDQDAPEVSALRKPQTVAHEGTHQILHNVGIQPRLSDWPLWLVEGLAEYCSSTRFARKGVEWAGLGQVNPIHLATIRDLDDPVPHQSRGDRREVVVPRERGMPLVEDLASRKDLSPTDYALSWALTHYLATQRTDDLVGYIKRMSRLRPFEEQSPADQLAAFREAFGTDLAQMDTRVGKYLKKFKPTDSLPHYAVIFEQPVGSSAIRRHYMVSQSPSVIRQWIESVTAPEGDPPHWQVLPHPTQKKALEAAEQWINSGH